ncbi:hypothetical protein [Pontibacter actiniarum]|uniref:Entericidin n=1 Tax=Pontibacter actiniarum TaxID=323450 RepID=A0A1X9YUP5_9BACT|nr:hypothetical protein [Pontibacter actiniarum]ARS36640.1 hypothetical protein CA264_15115 [Pontibacter actiniarum]
MKKVFGLLFVAGLFAFASCNNAEEATTEAEVTEETVVEEAPVVEDSTALEADTTVATVDSAAAAL